jgi:hypothetical protein
VFWTTTDEQGRFQFHDLPSGNYLVGHEIWTDEPSQFSGDPTEYFPGVARREQATVVHLSPNQSVDGIAMRLSSPHTPRSINVEVVWPDGTRPTENLLQLFDGQSLIRNIGWRTSFRSAVPHQGTYEFTGYEQRAYKLHARYWIDEFSGPVPDDQKRIAITDLVEIKPGKGPLSVRLVLTESRVAKQEEIACCWEHRSLLP